MLQGQSEVEEALEKQKELDVAMNQIEEKKVKE